MSEQAATTGRTVGRGSSVEVAPLFQRVAAMAIFRTANLAVCLLLALLSTHLTRRDVTIFAGYAVVSLLLVVTVWLPYRWLAVKAFGASLLLDGVFLQYVHDRLGHAPATDVVLAAQLVAVCLLASFRTGIKLAVWQSLMVLLAWRSEEAGLVPLSQVFDPAQRGPLAAADTTLLWLVVLTTSAAASINERELRRRRYDAEALQRMASSLLTDDRPQAVTHRLLDFVVSELNVSRAVVIARPPDGDGQAPMRVLARTAAVVSSPSLVPAEGSSAASALLDLAASSGRPALAYGLDPGRDPLLCALMPMARRVAAIPIGVGALVSRASGPYLVVEFGGAARGGRVERRIVSAALQAAATAAIALSRSELLEQARRAAVTDGLTGLANRRAFDQTMIEFERRWREESVPFALILADVDFFKSVNDRFGHPVGDEVLKVLGQLLSAHAPSGAIAARYGGEEFAMVLGGADTGAAAAIAERVRLALHEIEEPVKVSASFGVGGVPEDASDVASVILAADEALLKAKQTGRDRVVIAESVRPTEVGIGH